ncbi:MAG: T9SS type A sorting domain-containing protein [Saprospiraceae bacterium]|nr:T9SS type A sorting domain-containing protein [Saprospiraceae bacterium]
MIKSFDIFYKGLGLTVLLIVMNGHICGAQKLNWIYKIGGLTAENGVAVALDSQENIFDLTNFQGNTSVNNELSFNSSGSTDMILRKSTSLGAILWAKKIGGKGNDTGYDLVADHLGNVFVTGSFQDSLFYDGQFVMAVTNKTAGFILRISSDGHLISHFKLESSLNVVPKVLSIVPGSQIVVSGNFEGVLEIFSGSGPFIMDAGQSPDVFTGRFTFGGVPVWAKNFGNAENVNIHHQTVDTDGAVFLTGDYRNTLSFITEQEPIVIGSAGLSDIYVVKLSGDGKVMWVSTYGGPGLDNGNAVHLDHEGNLLITGRFSNNVNFNPGQSEGLVISNGSGDVFLLKLNRDGAFIWVKSWGSPSNDAGRTIVTNSNGIIFLGGMFRDSMVTDFSNPLNSRIVSAGGDDMFYLVLNQDGTYNDHFRIGGMANEQINDFALKNNGELISVGAFGAIVDFDPSQAVINIISTGGLDAFMLNISICVNPYLKELRVLKPVICSGDRGIVQIMEGYLNGASQWSWQRNDCNSITFASGDFIDLRLTQSVTYYIKGTGGCIEEPICHRADIRVFTDTLNYLNAIICEGGSISVGDNIYNTTGVYIDSLPTPYGCDSVIVTELLVPPSFSFVSYDTICHGDSILVQGQYLTNPGIYRFTYEAESGCDSTYIAYLTVIPSVVTTQDITICEGDSFFIGDQVFTQTGTYTLSMISEQGCEDFLITHLYVVPKNHFQEITLCGDESFSIGDKVYTLPGIYLDTLISQTGCDSIVQTTIVKYDVFQSAQEYTLCSGESITVGNSIYSATGIYLDTFQTVFGCDSIIRTTLTVLPVPEPFEIFAEICKGDSWTVNGKTYSEPGIYTDTLAALNGCDSLVITHLSVLETIFEQHISICPGNSIMIGDSTYNAEGTYMNIFQGSAGCDSIVITNLTFLPVSMVENPVIICPGDSIFVGNSVYFEPGVYSDTLLSLQTGCDSIVSTTLSWHTTVFSQEITLCKGDSITIGNNTYNQSGVYLDTLLNANGCLSMVTTTIYISEPASFIETSICEGELYTVGNVAFSSSGLYYITLSGENGCDSIVTLDLRVIPVIRTEGYIEICKGDSVILGNQVFYGNGVHLDTMISSLGCDSISRIVVHLIEVDTAITVDGNLLSVFAQDGLEYRWYNCSRPDSILSAPNQAVFMVNESGEYAVDILFKGCVFSTNCVRVEITGTDDISYTQVRLFPNPANHTLNLELPQDGYIRITGLDGKLLQSQKVQAGLQTLDISTLTSGSYILRWITDRQQYSIRFVKL